MAKKTIKAKKGKKPSSKHFAEMAQVSAKKGPAAGEVGGKMSPGAYYACWNCGKTSYAQFGWDFFVCPFCGVVNWV